MPTSSSRLTLIGARLRWRHLVWLMGLPLALGCQGEHLKPEPPAEPGELYWMLELNTHAVTMSTTAPYDTLSLTATPRNYQGAPLAGLPVPQYTSSDPTRVTVSPEGVLKA